MAGASPSNAPTPVGIGIIGAGLMGRELASAVARWPHLRDMPVVPRVRAVCDVDEAALAWFRQFPDVELLTRDHRRLLEREDVDVVYVALPHQLHEQVYLDVLAAGKDLMAEKPFGIDLAAAERIAAAVAAAPERFVRCSSEFPFFPAVQRLVALARAGGFGRLLEIRSAFLHASDLDPEKPINWKRRVETCGEIGVMGDLGLHVVHVPFRLGWRPSRVYADLEQIVEERPDGRGGRVPCDTWDNAALHCRVPLDGYDVPMTLEMKRIAPGEMNTWSLEVRGTEGGASFSTKAPKTLWSYSYRSGQPDQPWCRTDVGSQSAQPTITGGIFEFGFTDAILQMWAAYLLERAGVAVPFGCATVGEALDSHRLFDAALASQREGAVVALP